MAALLATSKEKHEQAITQVKEAEIVLQQADSKQRTDEKLLAETRETQIRQEAVNTQSAQAITLLTNQIAEKLSVLPDDLAQITEYSEEKVLPELQQLEERVTRLLRERDSIGPVNLRAEIEMKEISEKLEQLRWLDNNFLIRVGITNFQTISVDTPSDIKKIEAQII